MQKTTYYDLHEIFRKDKSMEAERRLELARAWVWEQQVTVNGYEGSHWGDENVLKLDYWDGCTTWQTY